MADPATLAAALSADAAALAAGAPLPVASASRLSSGASGARGGDAANAVMFSSVSGQYFADLLSKQLGIARGSIERKVFGDGEDYYRLMIDDRNALVGKDVILVCPTPKDVDFLELQRVGYALARVRASLYGTRRRIFVVPFLGFSTMERAVRPGEVVSAKTNIAMMSAIPNTGLGNVFLFLDLHVQGLVHYFEGPAIRVELYAEEVLLDGIRRLNLTNFMFASADLGRPKWVETFARKFNVDIAFIRKSRQGEETHVVDVIGDVRGKNVIIYDDMTRSAGTLIHAADKYLECGAESVHAVLSHLALNNEDIVDKLIASKIKRIVATNSHPMSQSPRVLANPDRFLIVDVKPVFARCIKDHRMVQ